MKLLIVIDTVNFNGGAHVATWEMIDALKARGVTVEILTGSEPNEKMRNRLEGFLVHIINNPFPRKGVRFLVQGICRRLKLGWVPNWTIDLRGEWRRKIAEYDTVLVIGENSHYRNLVASVKGPKKVVFIHTDYVGWRTAHSGSKGDTRCDWWTYRGYDKIAVVGRPNAERFVSVFPQFKDKVCAFHNIIQFKREGWQHNSSSKKLRFVTISRLNWGPPKKIERYIRLVARLKAKGYDFEWKIFGDGSPDETKRLKAYLEELNAGDVIKLMGFTATPQKEIISADIMALLSDYEGMANAIYESLLCGTPVVATDVGGASEQIEDGVTGRVVANNDEAIEAALIEILENRSLADAWRKNLLDYTYDNAKVVDEYMEILM